MVSFFFGARKTRQLHPPLERLRCTRLNAGEQPNRTSVLAQSLRRWSAPVRSDGYLSEFALTRGTVRSPSVGSVRNLKHPKRSPEKQGPQDHFFPIKNWVEKASPLACAIRDFGAPRRRPDRGGGAVRSPLERSGCAASPGEVRLLFSSRLPAPSTPIAPEATRRRGVLMPGFELGAAAEGVARLGGERGVPSGAAIEESDRVM
ncbi:hypothetical protein PVAP13_3KG081327 [Panicum virgatum]|uniref:Uncharacterized protein n=1 Tax=Panicum virgatum TaxID=38727 RepID=A0A8T0UUF0_PANVG|nr:hypothetical protein PVAP13_3KG081327 [Panicum virgatum]